MSNTEIANILFPQVQKSLDFYNNAYPARTLDKDAVVSRFGPSPTGFLHIGGLFSALISERFAHANNGTFFLRIEDTDKKREVENGVKELVDALTRFGIKIDEGINDKGEYGPYVQSERKEIYLTIAKFLVEQGLAYPCFCTSEELEATRTKQEELKIRPGYYGEWAVHRNITLDEIKQNIEKQIPFVLRLKSPGSDSNKYNFNDEVKGKVSVTENDQDIVLIKSDGLPTYHFAHVVDDHFMGTTHVIRGDEWLSSLPIHLQLFRMLGWTAPKYGHISPILKSENGNKRKLSKRKDPEAAVEYYLQEGYPNEAVIEYLLNIANSDFEDWRKENPDVSNEDFHIKLTKLSKSGALFDINKLNNISKDVISRMSAEEVYKLTLTWANTYDTDFATRMIDQKEYFINLFSIERNGVKPRKDFGKWSDVKESVEFFFDDLFITPNLANYAEGTNPAVAIEVILRYANRFTDNPLPTTKEDWFADLKAFASECGFTADVKEYKANPEKFKGAVGDVAMMLRVAVTGRMQTPDLFEMINVMGLERFNKRLNDAVLSL